jgi:uncharacterized protein YfaS (alpha-2-macroglobulin family)
MRAGRRIWLCIAAFLPLAAAPAAVRAPQSMPAPPLTVRDRSLLANQDEPSLCFAFSQTVARPQGVPLESFVGIEPKASLAAVPRSDRLCLTGLAFGIDYTVTLKAGLPGVSGALAKDTAFRVFVPTRPPELDFAAPGKDLLPRLGAAGLPIRSVNVPRIAAALFRIADRDLLLHPGREPLTGAMLESFAPVHGAAMWRGELPVKVEANRDTVTLLPVETLAGALEPGLYVAAAWPADRPVSGTAAPLATQYFTVSDIALSAFRGRDSLVAATRSLATGAATGGVDVALLGADNREIARVRSDGEGFARFDAASLAGTGGDAPAAIYAYGPAGDFTALTLDQPSPAAPGLPIILDREVYHPGGTIGVTVLAGAAVARPPTTPADRPSLTVSLRRPDGLIVESRTADLAAGGAEFAFRLPDGAPPGDWHIETALGADAATARSTAVRVDAADASLLAVSLAAEAAVIDPLQPGMIAIDAREPGEGGDSGGLPAALAPGELDVSLAPALEPFAAFRAFTFGLEDERPETVRLDAVRFATDADGKANVPLRLPDLPRSTHLLEARITARILDPGGRAASHSVSVPVGDRNLLLGVKAVDSAAFSEGQPARFAVIAVGPDGALQDKRAVGWEVLRRETVPAWYWDGTRFAYRPRIEEAHVAGGQIDISAAAPAPIAASLPVGDYRIAVFDPDGSALSGIAFSVGWAEPTGESIARTVDLNPAKPFLVPGEAAEVFVKPPFPADVMLATAGPELRDIVVPHVPAAGATVKIDNPDDSAGGFSLLASAVGPPATQGGLPRRAVGQAWLAPEPERRHLTVTIDLPDRIAPRQSLAIPVAVTGAADEPVAVTLSAIDDTDTSEDTELEKSALDRAMATPRPPLVLQDVYDRIIQPLGWVPPDVEAPASPHDPVGGTGRIPGPAHIPGPALSAMSGIVALDKTGHGTATLALPDFSGAMRGRAIAWSASRIGVAEARVLVHDPVSVDLAMPPGLAPDDRADLSLAIDNIDGPRGEYRLTIRAGGAISVQGDPKIVANLAEHEQRTQPVAVLAHGSGDGTITVSIEGPGGIAFERRFSTVIRPAAAPVFRHETVALKPGATLAPDPALMAGLRPESTAGSMVFDGGGFDAARLTAQLEAAPSLVATGIIAAATAAIDMRDVGTLDEAVGRLQALQQADGGFVALAGTGENDLWLTAFVADFLARAGKSGATAAGVPLAAAVGYLTRQDEAGPGSAPLPDNAIEALAWRCQVLAQQGRIDLFRLHYLSDRIGPSIRAPLARARLAAAFAALGDKDAASSAFAAAATPADKDSSPELDLRDQAVLTAIMAESGAAPADLLRAVAARTAAAAAGRRQFTTAEALWLYRARMALAPAGGVRLKVDDKILEQPAPLALTFAPGAAPPTVRNVGDLSVQADIAISGALAPGEPRDPIGYELQRSYFDLTGKPADPANLRQNDHLVVVLTGRFTGQSEPHPVVTDGVAGGWKVEAARLIDPGARFPWLKDLTETSRVAIENGRYLALPTISGDHRDFKLAYVVRAAFRGQFTVPAAWVEDMAQPALIARTQPGRTKIDAAP